MVHGSLFLSLIVMVIGFTEERQYVSENEIPGVDEFLVFIQPATLRVSEREHGMLYRLLPIGTATVVSFASFSATDFDAHFGDEEGDPIEGRDFQMPGEDTIRPLRIQIFNDFIPEDEECFTILISPLDMVGVQELFMCDFVDMSTNPPTNYFCQHTICIKDDDGNIILHGFSKHKSVTLFITIIDPYQVAFVETIYTVSEDVGIVEVCVNLTQPQFDIFDEFVVVEVIDFPSSVYVPANVTLASELLLYRHLFC